MAKLPKIGGVAYTRRFNLGNYEHEEYTVSAAVEETDAVTTIAQLKGAIEAAKSADAIPWPDASETIDKSGKQKTGAAKPTGKKAAPKKAAKPTDDEDETEEDEEEDLEDEEETDDDSETEESEEDEEETDGDEDEEESPAKGSKVAKKAPAKKAAGKTFKKKGTAYSRNSDLHKKLFVETIKEVMGDKFMATNSAKAKAISIKLEGADFLDADGEVTDTFKAEIKKLSKAK